MTQAIHEDKIPTSSQRTSLMLFVHKPKKAMSYKPSDKRHVSLVNSDMKIITGIEAARFQSMTAHTLHSSQLVMGSNKSIIQGINECRDCIQSINRNKGAGGIMDLDSECAFDFLIMGWVFKVLLKKGVNIKVINRLKRIYQENYTKVSINNIRGKKIFNRRLSLKQGDVPSMYWFMEALDPLLVSLDNKLKGILVRSIPILGPLIEGCTSPLVMEERYKMFSYTDDVKPGVTDMSNKHDMT